MQRKLKLFDIETDGLDATKIHCLVGYDGKEYVRITDYIAMHDWLSTADVLIGHNIIRFDIPICQRLLGVDVKAKLVDTLALSWYLEPTRDLHGLESWGETFGIEKPEVTDWENLSVEEYLHRCTEDVKINVKLWNKQWKHLLRIYENEDDVWRLIDYLSFKMDCARQQEADRWRLDVPKAEALRATFEAEIEVKIKALAEAMPKRPIIKQRTKPTKMYLKGKLSTLTKAGEAWYDLLSRVGLPSDYEGVVGETVGFEEPNPGSHVQIKKWLYELDWEPESFEYKRNKETNEFRKIPQIKNKQDDSGGLCPSVRELFEKEPALEVLEGLSILEHRLGIVKGFLRDVDSEGYIKAQVAGFTNTLRFKHRTVVNLPGVDKPYGGDIRGCLIAPEGYELCGSDMSSLEDRTGMHYISQHDPDLVERKSTKGYDPHLEMAKVAGFITQEELEFYKWYKSTH